jgi:hypothetical protein
MSSARYLNLVITEHKSDASALLQFVRWINRCDVGEVQDSCARATLES